MAKKIKQDNPFEVLLAEPHPAIEPSISTENPDNSDMVLDDDPFETPLYEIPPPGEGFLLNNKKG